MTRAWSKKHRVLSPDLTETSKLNALPVCGLNYERCSPADFLAERLINPFAASCSTCA